MARPLRKARQNPLLLDIGLGSTCRNAQIARLAKFGGFSTTTFATGAESCGSKRNLDLSISCCLRSQHDYSRRG